MPWPCPAFRISNFDIDSRNRTFMHLRHGGRSARHAPEYAAWGCPAWIPAPKRRSRSEDTLPTANRRQHHRPPWGPWAAHRATPRQTTHPHDRTHMAWPTPHTQTHTHTHSLSPATGNPLGVHGSRATGPRSPRLRRPMTHPLSDLFLQRAWGACDARRTRLQIRDLPTLNSSHGEPARVPESNLPGRRLLLVARHTRRPPPRLCSSGLSCMRPRDRRPNRLSRVGTEPWEL